MTKKAENKSIDKAIFYEISAGTNGFAYISDYASLDFGSSQHSSEIERCVAANNMPDCASLKSQPMPPDGNRQWSMVAEEGCNRYIVQIDGSVDAYFHKTSDPVICLAPHFPPQTELITDAIRHNDFWASFVVDTGAIRALKPVRELDVFEIERTHYVSLPLYLNIIDSTSDAPVWLAANHFHSKPAASGQRQGHNHGHDHEISTGNGTLERRLRHGGAHLTSLVNLMYVPIP